jgi:hypothetical protein
MKELTVTTWERVQLRNLLLIQPQPKTFLQGELGWGALKVLKFTEEERAEIKMTDLPGGGASWKESLDHPWELEFPEDVLQFLYGRVFHPEAIGWEYDERNRPLKDKMDGLCKKESDA